MQSAENNGHPMVMSDHGLSAEGLRKKLFNFFALALLLIMVSLITGISYTLLQHMKEARENDLLHAAQLRAMALGEWFRRLRDISVQITSRTRIRQELEKFDDGLISAEELKAFTDPKLADAMGISRSIAGIVRMAMSKEVVACCGMGVDLSVLGKSPAELWGDDFFLTFPISVDQRMYVIASTPIINAGGRRLGTDLIIVDTDELIDLLRRPDERNFGEKADLILGYAEDMKVSSFKSNDDCLKLHSVKSHNLHFHSLPWAESSEFSRQALTNAFHGETGVLRKAGDVLVFYPVVESGWAVALRQDEASLFGDIYKHLLNIGGVALVVYLLILAIFRSLMKPMAGRFMLHSHELKAEVRRKTESLEKEIAERIAAQEEREMVIEALSKALGEIKTLHGLLPICSFCKKIRDDKGYWNQLEDYIRTNSNVDFTHSMCPECAKREYPNFYQE